MRKRARRAATHKDDSPPDALNGWTPFSTDTAEIDVEPGGVTVTVRQSGVLTWIDTIAGKARFYNMDGSRPKHVSGWSVSLT